MRQTAWLGVLAAAVLLSAGGCSRVFWRPDLGGALRLAAERNQIVVVSYWSVLDADCIRMDDQVFRNKDVVDCLRNTIPVRLSALTSQKFAEDCGLTMVPAFVIFGPDGQILRTAQGYMNEARFRGMVEAARLGM